MAKTRKIGQNQDHGGNELRNFVLWLRTTAQLGAALVKNGMMAFDSTTQKVVVLSDDTLHEVLYKETQIEKTLSFTIASTDDRNLLWLSISAGGTVTIDTLPDDFYCEFYNAGAAPVSFVAGTATVNFPDGYILEQNKICTVMKRNSNAQIYVKGELTS